jgi:deoxycytidylate deaminase
MNHKVNKVLNQVALDNDHRYKMASAIVHKANILAVGISQYKTHPMMNTKWGFKEEQIYLHAEVDAIRNALRTFNKDIMYKFDLYVWRVKQIEGEWVTGLAKPCLGCQHMIEDFAFKNVYYSKDF